MQVVLETDLATLQTAPRRLHRTALFQTSLLPPLRGSAPKVGRNPILPEAALESFVSDVFPLGCSALLASISTLCSSFECVQVSESVMGFKKQTQRASCLQRTCVLGSHTAMHTKSLRLNKSEPGIFILVQSFGRWYRLQSQCLSMKSGHCNTCNWKLCTPHLCGRYSFERQQCYYARTSTLWRYLRWLPHTKDYRCAYSVLSRRLPDQVACSSINWGHSYFLCWQCGLLSILDQRSRRFEEV